MTRLPPDLLDDPALQSVMSAIEAGGHRVLLVGGAVRNPLLGRPVDDIDLATDAPPDRVMALTRDAGLKPLPTGIEHGTVTVVAQGRGFEVTTFRRDVATDGRHAVVTFSSDLEQDARRRDFTMNALYAGRDGRVLDPTGGLPDLAEGRLRFVGDPDARITEDYLRILRFFRFLAWYGRTAQPEAVAACAAHRAGLARISAERIGAEMRKLLQAPDPGPAVALMARTGVLGQILPGADMRAGTEALPALIAAETEHGIAPDWRRRLALLDAGPDAPERLRLSRAEARHLSLLTPAPQTPLDEIAYRRGAAVATDHALLAIARGQPQLPDWTTSVARAAAVRLPISARDLPDLQGPALGRGLRAAEAAWIAADFQLPAPALIDIALAAGKDCR